MRREALPEQAALGHARHAAQLYRADGALCDRVADILARDFSAGRSLLIVATAANRSRLEARLAAKGVDCDGGRVLSMDAHATLGRFMDGSLPDFARFGTVMDEAMSTLGTPRSGISVYGEMVDVLYGWGNRDGAEKLEECWNRLLEEKGALFSLLCSCSLNHFAGAAHERDFEYLCDLHDRVLPAEGSPLETRTPSELLRGISTLQQRALTLDAELRSRGVSDATFERLLEDRREAESRFRLMADHAPVLLWLSGTDSNCYFFNEGWLRFTGRTMNQETGIGWTEGVHPEDFERCMRTYTEAFVRRESFVMEYRLQNAAGEYRWVCDHGVPRFTAGGHFAGYVGSAFDVTDALESRHALRESRDALSRSEEQLRRILDAAPDGILTVDSRGRVLTINPAGEAMFRCTEREFAGRPVQLLVPGDWLEDVKGTRTEGRADGPHVLQAVGIRADGTTFSAEVSASRFAHGGVSDTVAIVRDCSNLRRLEQEILETGEVLRRKLGQDLHDDLGQLLTGIAFLAQGLMDDVAPELRARVGRLVTLANGAIPRAHKIAEGLAPAFVAEGSLSGHLSDLARTTAETFDVGCAFTAYGEFSDLDAEARHNVFLIAQEAVTNAVRHGKGTRIEITLALEGSHHVLTVRDDGRGFSGTPHTPGLGLRSMEYRARMLAGTLDVRPLHGRGVEVRCRW